MALSFYPSADQRLDVVSTLDPAVEGANPPEALEAYRESGDLIALTVPADASRFTLAPLTASAASQAARDAGVTPRSVVEARKRLEARQGAGDVEGDLAPEDEAALIDSAGWRDRHALALLRYSVKAVSDFPGVVPARRGSLEAFPDAVLERLPPAVRHELAAHVERISRLGPKGKAS